jgi:hypothetical protein
MAYTPVFSQGVKFIKIARIDGQGNDNTLSLQELDSIRIKFSDVGIVEYPITSIAKYDDYFLFGIATTNTTSSTDNQILNYRFKAGWTGSLNTSATLTAYNLSGSVSYDNLNYFNTSSGQYILGNQPNIPITITSTASISSNTGGNVFSQLQIVNTTTGLNIASSSIISTNNSTQIVSASFSDVLTENTQIGIFIFTDNTIQVTSSFFVTQSISPQTGVSDLVVLQPFIDADFATSEYNVLEGNAIEARINPFYMDVDYSTNALRAVNIEQILSGSATRATVQPSNYTYTSHINGRYNGSKTNSINYNTYTPPTDYTTSSTSIFGYNEYWPGDQAFGKQTSIDIYSNYFAVFTNIEQNDVFTNSGNIIINKLIDIDGNIIDLTSNVNTDSYYIGNKGITVSQIFTPNNQVNIYFATSSSLSFTSANTIIDAACDYKTILFYTGSNLTTAKFILDSKTPSTTAEVSVRSFITASGAASTTNTIVENIEMALGNNTQFTSLVTQLNGGTYDGRNFFNLSASAFDPSPNQFINNISLYNPNEIPVFDNQGDISVSSAYRFTPLTPTYIRVWLTSSGETNENSLYNSTITEAQVKYLRPAKQDTAPTQILSGSIELYTEISSSYIVSGSASMRMYTRLPKDNIVLVNNIPSSVNGTGLLIPLNFNPAYNPIQIARDARVI